MSWDWMEILQPNLRHVREERERLELTVEHPDSGAPPFGIDLDGGIARFTMPAVEPAEDEAEPTSP
ncbi:MAG: DUF6191 domain-containing protein [Actinomycetales bacterium]